MISIISAYQLRNLKVDFNFESFFEEESEDRMFFNQHKKVFGYDNDYLLLIIRSEKGLFNQSLLQALNSWEKKANEIDGVAGIQSPLGLKHIVQNPFDLSSRKIRIYD